MKTMKMQQNLRVFLQGLNLQLNFQNTRFSIIDSGSGVFLQSFPRHMHGFYELHFIFNGKGILVTDTTQYALHKGDIFIVPPHYNHEQIPDPKDPMEEFHISFTVSQITDRKSFAFLLNSTGFWISHCDEDLSEIYGRIAYELYTRSSYMVDMLTALFTEIFIHIFRLMVPQNIQASTGLSTGEMRSIKIDEAFLYDYATITLPSLAATLNLSKNQTLRLIKERYGKSFIDMRTISRLNAATDLLTRTTLSISSISEQCGFSNPIYFTEQFKKQFHTTPRDYRKLHTS